MKSQSIVWSGTLDKKFEVIVYRKRPYKGYLIVKDIHDNQVIHRQDVTINYDAQYGPDINDIDTWQGIAMKVADKVVAL